MALDNGEFLGRFADIEAPVVDDMSGDMSKDQREIYYRDSLREFGPQYAGFDLLSTETVLSLSYTYDMYHQISSRYLADFGLSRSALNVMFLLRHAAPGGMLLHSLGELLLVSKANVTGLVDHLQNKGFVDRVVGAHDRRERFARLTLKGEALLQDLAPLHYQNTTELLKGLTVDEKEILISLLQKTRSSFTERAGSLAQWQPQSYKATEG